MWLAATAFCCLTAANSSLAANRDSATLKLKLGAKANNKHKPDVSQGSKQQHGCLP
jgi:hypothetical protein